MKTKKNTISAVTFGAKPENKNNAAELRKAVDACKGRKDMTLVIPPGVYHFRDEEAIELRDTVMAGKFGGNVAYPISEGVQSCFYRT